MCISVYSVELFQKVYDVMKLCDKLEILKRQIKVIFMCKVLEVEMYFEICIDKKCTFKIELCIIIFFNCVGKIIFSKFENIYYQ